MRAHIESEENMAIDYSMLGMRINRFRSKKGYSQEELSERAHLSREHLARIETAKKIPSLEVIIDIANTLGVSADDLLVDSLVHSSSTADSELHKLLLDCNDKEEQILTRTVKELKAILYSLGI